MKSFLEKEFILNHTLKPLQNLVLLYPTSETRDGGKLRAWAFKVASTNLLKIPYNSLLPAIPADTAMLNTAGNPYFARITKSTFNDPDESNNYLHVPFNDPFLMYDYAIGIAPEDMRLYKAYNGTYQRVIFPDEELEVGDDHDFIDGQVSPLEMPTVYSRDIITKNIKVRYGFYNDCDHEERPTLNILGAVYSVVPYTDPASAKRVIFGNVPREVHPVFGLRSFNFTKPDEWPNEVELDQTDLQQVIA